MYIQYVCVYIFVGPLITDGILKYSMNKYAMTNQKPQGTLLEMA